LKAKVKADPVGTIGERLTYISEDLSERLGDEVSFITGDRVDLLMKDQQGNYVVIEIEPQVGPDEHIGFHQAAKYWVLVAVQKAIPLERVRRMVVATSIDRRLRDHYRQLYGIESFEVSL
jgi:RecB family endonuclease NucS